MADTTVKSLGEGVETLGIATENGTEETTNGPADDWDAKFGFPLPDLFKLAVRFYREKDGKAIHLSYKDKLKLVAYSKQAIHGKFHTDATQDVGFLNVVGSDRRQAWQALGDMPKETAMSEFVKLLDELCPLFAPYVKAHKAEQEEKIRKEKEAAEARRREEEERQRQEMEEAVRKQQELERQKQLETERQIREALNQQTAIQFRQYAEQQLPEQPQKQQELIQQLQEQHFQQYMQQVYQQQVLHQQQQYQQLQAMQGVGQVPQVTPQHPQGRGSTPQKEKHIGSDPTATQLRPNGLQSIPVSNSAEHEDVDLSGDETNNLPPIAAASMWTRKDLKEFKESLNKDKESVIKVGSGETITVRVPTHEDGTCLFWEFATDYYDIGFGVNFEWTIAPSNQVSVHVSESSDEEDLEDEEVGADPETKGDIERGKKRDDRPPTDEIIPVYRRDCHEEVYCGSHTYPGRGVYLLKFDNSYSLWRSKTLYYRVYYTR
ncbi:Golgi resident protein GCP60-like [Liolophura sinensis]|uniref:Golgi resident protein GCP60-like n=1 Tax=Liolophura sinensis TaxID=3198878 RepID=UPI0031595759